MLVFVLALQLVSAVHINEIMYNPVGDDNNKEFVEILGTDNLTDYTIGDLASNDSLELVKFVTGNLSLIVEESFNHSNINCTIYSVGATIGNNLNNVGDTIFLYNNSILVDFTGYDGSLANSNDYSLALVNGSWQESCESGGSPGLENCIAIDTEPVETNTSINETFNESVNDSINESVNASINITKENNTNQSLKLEIIIPDVIYLGMIQTSLFKITNLEHVTGEKDAVLVVVKYNITQNKNGNISLIKEDFFNKTINHYSSSNTGILFFEQTGNYTLCGLILNTSISKCKEFAVIDPRSIPCFIEVNLSTDKELYVNQEKVKIKNYISNKTFPYFIEYWVEDLFGEEVKKKYETSNTNQKTWTSKISEVDRVFLVKNRLSFIACNNSNPEIENEKMIIIKKEKVSIGEDDDSDSVISIDYVYLPKSGNLVFGDDFNVKLSIHKGDTSKSVVSVLVLKEKKRVSEETKFYLNKKNYDYNITVNIKLKTNCNQEFNDGNYEVVVNGLGQKAEENIVIQGNKKGVCKQESVIYSGEITSFYSRSKKFKPKINLYANIKAEETKGTYKAILQSKSGKQSKAVNSSETIKFEVEAEPGPNLFFLRLEKDNNSIDTKSLVVKLEAKQEKTSVSEELLSEKNNKTNEELNQSINFSLMPISGTVVYESDNVKIKKYAPYFLSFVLTLIIVGLVVSKRR